MKHINVKQAFVVSTELDNLIKQRNWLEQRQAAGDEVRLRLEGHASAGSVYVDLPLQGVVELLEKKIAAKRDALEKLGVTEVAE